MKRNYHKLSKISVKKKKNNSRKSNQAGIGKTYRKTKRDMAKGMMSTTLKRG